MTSSEQRITTDAVLFDMDGTLIDESGSYREAIRLTAEYVLKEPVTADEVDEIKRLPGFNNDWDATWALIGKRMDGAIRQPEAADRESSPFQHMSNIFQTYYLGHELWGTVSDMEPPFEWTEPLIARETPLVLPSTLDRLSGFALGIATSRPRMEAILALRRHALNRYFDSDAVVASEDAAFQKPHPAPLLELSCSLACRRPVYVGDTINDALAAAAAGMPFFHIGIEPLADPSIPVHARLVSVQSLPSMLIRLRSESVVAGDVR
jgi:HAD superfamily hydrolase (TIGR01548 family)